MARGRNVQKREREDKEEIPPAFVQVPLAELLKNARKIDANILAAKLGKTEDPSDFE